MTPPPAETIALTSAHARARVSTTAAMLVDAEFDVDGRTRRPFALAPWVGIEELSEQPGHLRTLGAEFVAVPFGSSGAPAGLGPEWADLVPTAPPERPHGRAADDEWSVIDRGASWVTLALDYPEPEDVSRLVRTVRLREDGARIDFELTLSARRPARTPVGLHPILRLPSTPGDLSLEVTFERGFTYPGTVWPGAGVAAPAQTFSRLDRVPAPGVSTVDLSRLPLSSPVEDIVLLAGVTSPVIARFVDDETLVRLDWDRELIPNVMLWLSDRALQDEPWNGRYRGLGVEPIAAAFDMDECVSVAPNPISAAGYATALAINPGTDLHLHYSIEVGSIEH